MGVNDISQNSNGMFKKQKQSDQQKSHKNLQHSFDCLCNLSYLWFVPIFLHRFSEYAENRKFGSVMFHVIPPGLNPIIYGLQAKDIRRRILKLCRNRVNSS